MKKIFSFLLFIIVLFSNCFLFAQWKRTGPYGGRVSSLAIKGNMLFAGTDNVVFVTSQKDTTWKEINNQSSHL